MDHLVAAKFTVRFLLLVGLVTIHGEPVRADASRADGTRAESETDKHRSRLEELFRWKVSDTLQLDMKQEEKLTEVLKAVSEKRKTYNERMDAIVKKIKESKNSKDTNKLIKEYKANLKKIGETQSYELEQLEKALGSEKLGQYIVLKNELSSHLKSVIAGRASGSNDSSANASGSGNPSGNSSGTASGTSTANAAKNFPAPKIIDETEKSDPKQR